MCPDILVQIFFLMASLIRKSRVDILTYRQEGVKVPEYRENFSEIPLMALITISIDYSHCLGP